MTAIPETATALITALLQPTTSSPTSTTSHPSDITQSTALTAHDQQTPAHPTVAISSPTNPITDADAPSSSQTHTTTAKKRVYRLKTRGDAFSPTRLSTDALMADGSAMAVFGGARGGSIRGPQCAVM